jgi:hypothetical protein
MASQLPFSESPELALKTTMATTKEELTTPVKNSEIFMATEYDVAASSAISELQTAFNSLLQPPKDKKLSNTLSASTYPKWTGSFELLCFPRELRDKIYFHYLYRPAGIEFDRHSKRVFPFDQLDNLASLFLTCRQVYEEALPIFYRYNAVLINVNEQWRPRKCVSRALEGTLRLFPEKPARMMQRARMQYYENTYISPRLRYNDAEQVAGEGFAQMLRDAYTVKSTFTKMRDFTVAWQASPQYFREQVNLYFEDKTEEEKVAIWLNRMRRWVGGHNVVPPRWVRFEFTGPVMRQRFEFTGPGLRQTDMAKHESAMNEAYVRLVKEIAPFSDEQAELEESERRRKEQSSSMRQK